MEDEKLLKLMNDAVQKQYEEIGKLTDEIFSIDEKDRDWTEYHKYAAHLYALRAERNDQIKKMEGNN